MAHLVEFPLEDGGRVVVEIDESENVVPAAGPGQIVERAKHSFEEILQGIKPTSQIILARLLDGSRPPDEIEIEFGLKIGAKLGAPIIASGDAEAHYKVRMKWNTAEAGTKRQNCDSSSN